jgi:hypothetical protein
MEPFSHIGIGQNLVLKHPPPLEGTKLYNVQVGKVDENQMLSYCSALHISAIILDWSSSYDSLYVKEIISPERSMAFSAGYLSHIFDKDNDMED